MVLEDARIADVKGGRPPARGEDVRIVHCLDAVEPRTKPGEGGGYSPASSAGMDTVGSGLTFRLDGVSVLVSSRYPRSFSGLLQAREAVVDMSGPAAVYSPMSRVRNVVLACTPNPDIENDDYDDAIRRAALRAAHHIAEQAVRSLPTAPTATEPEAAGPDSRAASNPSAALDTTVFDFSDSDPGLPNVVYFYQLQGQGSMADTYLYGRTIHNLVPTLIHPNEVIDGP